MDMHILFSRQSPDTDCVWGWAVGYRVEESKWVLRVQRGGCRAEVPPLALGSSLGNKGNSCQGEFMRPGATLRPAQRRIPVATPSACKQVSPG